MTQTKRRLRKIVLIISIVSVPLCVFLSIQYDPEGTYRAIPIAVISLAAVTMIGIEFWLWAELLIRRFRITKYKTLFFIAFLPGALIFKFLAGVYASQHEPSPFMGTASCTRRLEANLVSPSGRHSLLLQHGGCTAGGSPLYTYDVILTNEDASGNDFKRQQVVFSQGDDGTPDLKWIDENHVSVVVSSLARIYQTVHNSFGVRLVYSLDSPRMSYNSKVSPYPPPPPTRLQAKLLPAERPLDTQSVG